LFFIVKASSHRPSSNFSTQALKTINGKSEGKIINELDSNSPVITDDEENLRS